jgi:hypothetical protein
VLHSFPFGEEVGLERDFPILLRRLLLFLIPIYTYTTLLSLYYYYYYIPNTLYLFL